MVGIAGLSLTRVTALWSLSKTHYPSLVLVQPRKIRPCLIERLLMGRKEKQTKPKQHLQRFMRYNIPEMISLGSHQTFYCTLSCKQFASYFKYT